jgi:hypothetical protein
LIREGRREKERDEEGHGSGRRREKAREVLWHAINGLE